MFFPLVPPCPPPPPLAAPQRDRPRYSLTVRIGRRFDRVSGDLVVAFTPNRTARRLVFRLWPNAPLQRERGSRLEVRGVRVNGRKANAERPNRTTLVVPLQPPLRPGETASATMLWSLRVPYGVPDRISAFAGGLRLGTFFPLLAWDPRSGWVTDPPALVPAESSTAPTADFYLRVLAPRGAVVVASGSPAGRGRWRAESVRDIGLAAGKFRVVTATAHAPARVVVRAAIARGADVDPRDVLQAGKASLERLSRMYGPYPWPRYTLVFPPDVGEFGIEYPTLAFVGDRMTTLVIQHETAHQWFYSLVGNDQARDPWLDEGLASWAEARLAGRFVRGLGIRARHVAAPMTYWGRSARAYATQVYGGSVVALKSLGPARAVDCALRLYVARNAYSIARPRDLLDALNEVFPGAERRLRRFGIHG